ncbi:hypothetical protein GQ600_13892 [Phytophthora cactorum]|nr:hypothetical protein GQ600_13892 [Phytophthora cactorum]
MTSPFLCLRLFIIPLLLVLVLALEWRRFLYAAVLSHIDPNLSSMTRSVSDKTANRHTTIDLFNPSRMPTDTCYDFPLLKDEVNVIVQDAVRSVLEGNVYDNSKVMD